MSHRVHPLLANMSAPPRTTVEIVNRVAPAGFLYFNLRRTLKEAATLLEKPAWHDCIFKSGLPRVPERTSVEAAAGRLPGFLIASPGRLDEEAVLVEDLPLAIALLSRRVDRLFIKARTPDYTIASLLESAFCVEDWRPIHERQEGRP